MRRARADWQIKNLELKANQTQFYLKDDTLEEKQKFFASLDVFRYHRFAEILENGESKRKNELDAKIFRALWDATNRDIILSLYSAAECASIMRNNLRYLVIQTSIFHLLFLQRQLDQAVPREERREGRPRGGHPNRG